MSLSVIYNFESKQYRRIFDEAVDYNGRILNIDILDQIDDEPENKVIQMAKVLRSIDYDIQEVDEEIKRLRKLKDVADSNKDQLKQYLQFAMLALGKKVIDTPTMKISLRNTNPKLVIEPDAEIPKSYTKVETTFNLDKTTLKEDIKNGLKIEGVYLAQDQTIVIS